MQKPKFNSVKFFIILILTLILVLPYISPYILNISYNPGRPSGTSGLIGCENAIRDLRGAIEMYNMDNTPYIITVDDIVIKLLKEKKYLKNNWPNISNYDRIRKKCKYICNGDLSGDGIIYCEYHGSHPRFESGATIPPSQDCIDDTKRAKLITKIGKISFPIIIIIIIILVVIYG